MEMDEPHEHTDLDDELFHADGDEERDELEEVEKLALRASNRVCIWKSVLILIISVAAAAVIAGTYRILSDSEQDDFEVTYALLSGTVKDGLEFHFSTLRSASASIAKSITGASSAYQQTFPFVMLPDFEIMGETVREQSGIEAFYYCPFVGLNQSTPEWTDFTTTNAARWINESRVTVLTSGKGGVTSADYDDAPMPAEIYGPEDPDRTQYAPVWQMSPPPFSNSFLNYDVLPRAGRVVPVLKALREPHGVFSEVHNTTYITQQAIRAENISDHPHCVSTVPVFKHVNDVNSEVVGLVQSVVAWDSYLVGLLPDRAAGITAVLENTCGQAFTYDLQCNSAFYRGAEDLHDTKYDSMKTTIPFYDFENEGLARAATGHCIYTFSLYPTQAFEDEHKSNMPMILAIVVGSVFFFTAAAFFMYDWFVQSRNKTVVAAAARASGIVSSMFPKQIRDRLLDQKEQEHQQKKAAELLSLKYLSNSTVDAFANEQTEDMPRAIADFFPETTIMFADIVGFTAWSSLREPSQVFELLETLYAAFDEIATQRRIFKVETVGDCYVAVAGLPEPRKDHAVAMARFAKECLLRMQGLLKTLEVRLGPDTGELSMRFGLNSGPVTGGVLRGQRSRFQLFGDTMNTASRMESTGRPNAIQLSHDTAELLKAAGKGSWLTARKEMTEIKGKGMMVTYWLNSALTRDGTSSTDGASVSDNSSQDGSDERASAKRDSMSGAKSANHKGKYYRLVQWNVEIVSNILRQIEAQRSAQDVKPAAAGNTLYGDSAGTVLDEVQEVISMPAFAGQSCQDPDSIELDKVIVQQLHDFVSTIASMYRDNKFHNFEHASHVTMAIVKLLSRVVNPKIDGFVPSDSADNASILHDYTYGITSDPLTQLACVFSSIIHDVDHAGVPNAQLLKENSRLAQVYKRSIAEQNSFDLAWNLFMDERFDGFRQAACGGSGDLSRFRQLVINLVMATDIMDKELNGFRNKRWERAFGAKANIEEAQKDKVDRKATIVIEHMIQASDVAHTMQHWHVYRKWNGRLFSEMYEAYATGRSDKDPSVNWYEGEIGFFDFYIIPLAKKLAECGVFGVASSEYLDYAMRNRREWENQGREVVAGLLEEARADHQHKESADSGERQCGELGVVWTGATRSSSDFQH